MKVNCYACGIELDSDWAEKIATGRKCIYICEKCRSKGDSNVRDAKDEFYKKHTTNPNKK